MIRDVDLSRDDDAHLRTALAVRLGAERLARFAPALRQAGADAAGVLFLIGIGWAIVRRYVQRPYRIRIKTKPEDHVILPEIISKEPLGPAVRHGDDRWFDIVKWSMFAMLEAEEMGLTQKSIDQVGASKDPAVQRFIGATGDVGKMLGIDNKWAFNIVKQVGNYGESFDANLKPLGFERGLNRLWNQGGLMYAPPIR